MVENEKIKERIGVVLAYFSDLRDKGLIPKTPILLNSYTTIIDVGKFLSATMPCVYLKRGDLGGYLPYLEQLERLMEVLKERKQ